jgi:Tol biopolymer transport system component
LIVQSCGSRPPAGPGKLSYITDDYGYKLIIENNEGELEAFPRDDISNYSWSPDGKKLVFESNGKPYSSDIYVINSDGSSEINLTNTQEIQESNPSWSPDGKKIVFISNHDGEKDLFSINSDGTKLTQLTHDMGRNDYPNWSPNGKYIYFTNWQDDSNNVEPRIFRIKNDGSEVVKLNDEGYKPICSPDGNYIIFQRLVNIHYSSIIRIKIDGSEEIMLTENGSGPSWSPDGKRIVYINNIGETNLEIFVMDKDGTNQINLTNNPGRDFGPIWSLDGKIIAFTSQREGDAPSAYLDEKYGNAQIYIMNSDGTNQTRITNTGYVNHLAGWKP